LQRIYKKGPKKAKGPKIKTDDKKGSIKIDVVSCLLKKIRKGIKKLINFF